MIYLEKNPKLELLSSRISGRRTTTKPTYRDPKTVPLLFVKTDYGTVNGQRDYGCNIYGSDDGSGCTWGTRQTATSDNDTETDDTTDPGTDAD